MDKEKLASFGIGIGVGLLIGSILGILYAPKSGKETRKLIQERSAKIREKIAGDYRAIRNRAKLSDIKP
jgi:gas vesicle protein